MGANNTILTKQRRQKYKMCQDVISHAVTTSTLRHTSQVRLAQFQRQLSSDILLLTENGESENRSEDSPSRKAVNENGGLSGQPIGGSNSSVLSESQGITPSVASEVSGKQTCVKSNCNDLNKEQSHDNSNGCTHDNKHRSIQEEIQDYIVNSESLTMESPLHADIHTTTSPRDTNTESNDVHHYAVVVKTKPKTVDTLVSNKLDDSHSNNNDPNRRITNEVCIFIEPTGETDSDTLISSSVNYLHNKPPVLYNSTHGNHGNLTDVLYNSTHGNLTDVLYSSPQDGTANTIDTDYNGICDISDRVILSSDSEASVSPLYKLGHDSKSLDSCTQQSSQISLHHEKPPHCLFPPPNSTSQPPRSTSQPPNSTFQPPKSTSQPLNSTSHPHRRTCQPPKSTSQPPNSSSKPPRRTCQPPRSTYQPPHSTSQPPHNTFQPPHRTSQPPSSTSQPPHSTFQPPNSTSYVVNNDILCKPSHQANLDYIYSVFNNDNNGVSNMAVDIGTRSLQYKEKGCDDKQDQNITQNTMETQDTHKSDHGIVGNSGNITPTHVSVTRTGINKPCEIMTDIAMTTGDNIDNSDIKNKSETVRIESESESGSCKVIPSEVHISDEDIFSTLKDCVPNRTSVNNIEQQGNMVDPGNGMADGVLQQGNTVDPGNGLTDRVLQQPSTEELQVLLSNNDTVTSLNDSQISKSMSDSVNKVIIGDLPKDTINDKGVNNTLRSKINNTGVLSTLRDDGLQVPVFYDESPVSVHRRNSECLTRPPVPQHKRHRDSNGARPKSRRSIERTEPPPLPPRVSVSDVEVDKASGPRQEGATALTMVRPFRYEERASRVFSWHRRHTSEAYGTSAPPKRALTLMSGDNVQALRLQQNKPKDRPLPPVPNLRNKIKDSLNPENFLPKGLIQRLQIKEAPDVPMRNKRSNYGVNNRYRRSLSERSSKSDQDRAPDLPPKRVKSLFDTQEDQHMCLLEIPMRLKGEVTDGSTVQAKHTHDLFVAARNGRTDYVKTLLNQTFVDVNSADGDGWTVLHHACKSGNPETVRLLLDRGADINSRTIFGSEPIMIALSEKFKVDTLRQWHQKDVAQIIHELVSVGSSVNLTDPNGLSTIMVALSMENNYNVDYLLDNGVDVNYPLHLRSILHVITAQVSRGIAWLEIERKALELGANPNVKDIKGQVPASLIFFSQFDQFTNSDVIIDKPDTNQDTLLDNYMDLPNVLRMAVPDTKTFSYTKQRLSRFLRHLRAGLDITRVPYTLLYNIDINLIRSNSMDVMVMFKACGHYPCFASLHKYFGDNVDRYNMTDIEDELNTPTSLMQLSASVIRSNIYPNAKIGANALEIPNILKQYITLDVYPGIQQEK